MRAYPASYGHLAYAFNAHLNADGTPNRTAVQNTTTIDRRESAPMFREGRDAYHLTTGGQLGRAHKGLGIIRLNGRILVPDASQQASLADREAAFRAAFDPELCYRDSPSTDGAYALDFQEPTTDTATYPTGRRAMRYYARPMAHPTLIEELGQSSLRYALGLVCPDPRCYEQTEQTLSLTPAGASGNVLNRGNVPAPIKLTITMAGAGHASFTLTRGGVAFILNLTSTTGGQVVVVVMETCGPYGVGRKITKAGADAFSLKTSGPSTWLDAPVGSTSFVMTNHTNVTSCVVSWYSARA
jgi:hypothetical protein